MYVTPDYINEPLYVILVAFNPRRYRARWKHLLRAIKYVKDSGAIAVVIEASFGERAHAVDIDDDESDPAKTKGESNHIYIRVQTDSELWIKENLINLAMRHLPSTWKYVAWIDADVIFARPNWVGETIHALQHYSFVQMFTQAMDLGPGYEISRTPRQSFMDGFTNGQPIAMETDYDYAKGLSTGLAWAARRDAINAVGGLMDFCIMGSADWHMAHALVGKGQFSYPDDLSSEYKVRIADWEARATRYIQNNVGAVSGLCLHFWHGKKVDRKYTERWQVLTQNDFRPSKDLKYDWQGLYQICEDGSERSIKLRDGVREYLASRDEDSITE